MRYHASASYFDPVLGRRYEKGGERYRMTFDSIRRRGIFLNPVQRYKNILTCANFWVRKLKFFAIFDPGRLGDPTKSRSKQLFCRKAWILSVAMRRLRVWWFEGLTSLTTLNNIKQWKKRKFLRFFLRMSEKSSKFARKFGNNDQERTVYYFESGCDELSAEYIAGVCLYRAQ